MNAALRWAFGVIAVIALCTQFPSVSDAGFVQLLRAQTAIYVAINVAPGPYGMRPSSRMLAYDGAHYDVAQVTKQSGVPVQANVVPNPTGTLLTTSTNVITLAQTAGTTATYPCAYHVKVTTTIPSWTLYTGLSNDFSSSFNGNTVSWLDYSGAPPSPKTYQRFTVYPDNNNAWQADRRGASTYDECVDLTVAIPIMVLGGSYSSNAVYTLYY